MKRKGITLATLAAGMAAGLHPYSHTVKVWGGARVSTDTQSEIMRKAFFKRKRKAEKFSRDMHRCRFLNPCATKGEQQC
jgi:hypothetical protein